MKFARNFLVFSYGLFTIGAQTLVFREFLTTFEGNDISVGIFFACWFLWIALGALAVYRLQAFTKVLVNKIEFLFLAYLPAFALQMFLIIYAREIASVEHFTLLSIRTLIFLSIIANAPVSLVTGMLFPTACRWIQQQDVSAVSRVYILEAAGSLFGGLGTTLLLALGVNSIRIAIILALLVSLSSAFVQLAKRKEQPSVESPKSLFQAASKFAIQAVIFAIPFFLLISLFTDTGNYINGKIQMIKWSRLLPEESFEGSFQTAQAEYLYGRYRGQWLIAREGSITESIPEQSETAISAAICLSQNPSAKKILVIGSGLSLAGQFLKLPQTEAVYWASCDNEYIKKITGLLPNDYKIADARFSAVSSDIRSFLTSNENTFDIVIINLPDATSSVLNRYFTVQFYRLIKKSLRQNGVITVRVSGGENVMGTELVNLGSSIKNTMQMVFSRFTLTAGEQSFFLASDSNAITDNSVALRDRLKSINESDKIISADALLSIYLPDRIEKALAAYDKADFPQSLLINRDDRPLTHLYSLLLASKQSGMLLAKPIKLLALTGLPIFLAPIVIIILMRFIFLAATKLKLKRTKQKPVSLYKSSFDSSLLAFTAGLSGIAVVIILMFLYQTRFGSLYLYIGVISSVFMLGLTIGAALVKFLMAKKQQYKPQVFLVVAAVLHILILAAIANGTIFTSNDLDKSIHFIFTVAFFLSGICTGSYFPIAAKQLSNAGFETGTTGSKLEMADHFGACVGGMLTSLLLIPILGIKFAIIFLIILVAANLPTALIEIFSPEKEIQSITTLPLRKKIGFTLFAAGASIIICSNLLAYTNQSLEKPLQQVTAQTLAGKFQIESHLFEQNDKVIPYYSVYDSDKKTAGYIFYSEDFAPEIQGFVGKINLALFVDTTGRLIDFNIIQSNETSEYISLIKKEIFYGKNLLAERPFEGVNAVTGATISFNAISSALQISANRFFKQLVDINKEIVTTSPLSGFTHDKIAIYLAAALALTLIVIYFGGFRTRLIFLTLNFAIGGLLLNAQFSTSQITNLLSLNLPSFDFIGVFLITAGIPLIVIIFGNIYCGYLCPFGALQELLSYIIPDKLKLPPNPKTIRKAAFTKHIMLFIVTVAFFATRKASVLAGDPLIKIFSGLIDSALIFIAGIALVGSLFYTRFWCVYLCPTGAFLSLLNKIALLKRLLTAKRFAQCEFAASAKEATDCIMCDRCRYKEVKLPATDSKLASSFFVTAVSLGVSFICTITINNILKAAPKSQIQSTIAISPSVPTKATQTEAVETEAVQTKKEEKTETENADTGRIKKLIETKKLSDKEALFYKKVE